VGPGRQVTEPKYFRSRHSRRRKGHSGCRTPAPLLQPIDPAATELQSIADQSRSMPVDFMLAACKSNSGKPDDRNDRRARLRSLSPGKPGCSISAYPPSYSCTRDGRTSLFRSYHFSLIVNPGLSRKQDSIVVVTLKAGDWVFPNHNISLGKLHRVDQ
jgi:hypothetical protein